MGMLRFKSEPRSDVNVVLEARIRIA